MKNVQNSEPAAGPVAGQSATATMADARPAPPAAYLMVPDLYRVLGTCKETADTVTLELAVDGDGASGVFLPGQFNMLYAFGVGEVPISISGDPATIGIVRHTVRAVGAVTKALCRLRPGQMIGVRGPFGTHWPLEEACGKDVLIVAGGIGLAPLRPAIYHILRHRKDYARVTLLAGARTPEDLLFKKELKYWGSQGGMDVHVTVDRAAKAWRGNVGVVTTLIPKALMDASNVIAMICGPELMMRFTIQALIQRGIMPADIHVSMERNMKCALGFCGHCQYGPHFICKDGPVFRYDRISGIFAQAEV